MSCAAAVSPGDDPAAGAGPGGAGQAQAPALSPAKPAQPPLQPGVPGPGPDAAPPDAGSAADDGGARGPAPGGADARGASDLAADAPPLARPAMPVTTRMLADGWMDATFGPTTRNGPTKPGLAVVEGARLQITGYGSGLMGKTQLGPESFYYVYKPLQGDGEIRAKIMSLTHAHEANVGVMFRAAIDATAWHGTAGASATDNQPGIYHAAFWKRYEISSAGVLPRRTGAYTLPLWIKAERIGLTITGYVSPDGVTWKRVDSFTYKELPAAAFAGIAVMSGWSRPTSATNVELEEVTIVKR